MRKFLIALSLALNLFLLGSAAYLIAQVGARPLAEHAGIVEPRRPAYNFYAQERFTDLPGAKIAVLGDSQVERGPWSEVLGEPVAVRGQGGATVAEVAGWADTIPPDSETVIIWAGTNDVLSGRTPAQIKRDMGALLASAKSVAPKARIVVLPVPPLSGHEVKSINQVLESSAREQGADFIDLGKIDGVTVVNDGVHVSPTGYALIADALKSRAV